jgi:hypothetical protein
MGIMNEETLESRRRIIRLEPAPARPVTTPSPLAGARSGSRIAESVASRGALPSRRLVSLLRYSPALVLVLVTVADAMRYADPDLWGHIRFGQAMLSGRHLTLSDPYSYSAAGHLWRNHEWLCEVLMAAAYNALGVVGLKLLKLLLTAATIVMLAIAEGETGAAPGVQLGVLTMAAVTLAPQMQFRPQLFTFLLLAALMAILTRDNCGRRAPLWLLIPILALWANLHGGFVIGVATLAIYAPFTLHRDFARGRRLSHGVRLFVIAIAATCATLATPYGIDAWYAVAHALSNPFTRLAVSDWQPLYAAIVAAWHNSSGGLIYFACFFAMLASLAYSVARAPDAYDLPLVDRCGDGGGDVCLNPQHGVVRVHHGDAAGAPRRGGRARAPAHPGRDRHGDGC